MTVLAAAGHALGWAIELQAVQQRALRGDQQQQQEVGRFLPPVLSSGVNDKIDGGVDVVISGHDGEGGSPAMQHYSEHFLVATGVSLAIASSFLVCLGLGLQKVSLCAPGNEHISPWQQTKWVAGFSLTLLGSVIDFLAFGMAPQSLLAPLAALSLVWNLGMSSYLLNEQYDKNDVVAVCLIFCGTALTVVYAAHKEHSYSLEMLLDLYHKPRMYAYCLLIPALLGGHYALLRYVAEHKLSGQFWKLCELIGWCGVAGITGGQSILFAKSTVELLKDAAQGQDVFWHLDTYVIIACMVGCLLTQITFLNGAMKRFDQLYVMPVYQSYWIISGVIGGLVYFGEYQEFDQTQINMFFLGTVVTLAGLFVLTKKSNHSLEGTGPQPDFEVVSSRRVSSASSFGFYSDDDTNTPGDIELSSPLRSPFNESPKRRHSVFSNIDADNDARRRLGAWQSPKIRTVARDNRAAGCSSHQAGDTRASSLRSLAATGLRAKPESRRVARSTGGRIVMSNFATLDSVKKKENKDGDGNEYYAGGGGGGDDVVNSIFSKAAQEGEGGIDALGEDTPVVIVRFFRNGFQVGDGPLRSFDDPANKAFLAEIHQGYCPAELVKNGKPSAIKLDERRGEDYVEPPPPAYVAFSGGGQSAGAAVSASSDSSVITPTSGAAKHPAPDASQPTIRIQVIFSHNRKREVLTFNKTSTVRALIAAIDGSGHVDSPYQMLFSQRGPPKPISGAEFDNLLTDVGLAGAAVTVKQVV
ncbi:Probable magnesium transporter NIPA8 [Durusdinium trenchii]|uniref:Probable magnesium transporter NIPA8 n=1 Tax=Durusdinium trenchii TaxID=1381693 RepID=A0ABP0SG79_9DINO